MSKAMHLNLLNPLERKSSSPVRGKFILAFAAGLVLALMLIWAGFVGVWLTIVNGQVSSVRSDIAARNQQSAESAALKNKLANLQSEVDQFGYYRNGRVKRGNLLRLIALAIPANITLTAMEIPEPEEQDLRLPPGVKGSPLQGPTSTVERVELRLTGLASSEQDIFRLMETLKGKAFTNDLIIAENPSDASLKSPRVLAFRQESSPAGGDHRNVFFDIAYQIMPRKFVK